MKKILFAFLMFFLFTSLLQAQWWTSGGNLLWPYGDVKINKGLSAGNDLKYNYETNFSEIIRAKHYFLTSQETWYGGSLFANFDDGTNLIRKVQPGSRMNGIDNFVWQKNNDSLFDATGMQTQIRLEPKPGAVWRNPSWPVYTTMMSYLVLGKLPYKSNFATGSLSIYEAVIDETPSVTAVDTIPFNRTFGYSFRMGSGNKHRYPMFYSFYSDLVSYSASTKLLKGYHFYGYGDYPSFFGGTIIQKVYTTNVSNPPTASELNAAYPNAVDGETIYIDDNNANTNFYQVVKKGTSWWIFTGTKAL